jgi:hypothetical protein
MKQLTVMVKPFRAEAVLRAVAEVGVTACVVREAKGYGRQKGYLDRCAGSEYSVILTEMLASGTHETSAVIPPRKPLLRLKAAPRLRPATPLRLTGGTVHPRARKGRHRAGSGRPFLPGQGTFPFRAPRGFPSAGPASSPAGSFTPSASPSTGTPSAPASRSRACRPGKPLSPSQFRSDEGGDRGSRCSILPDEEARRVSCVGRETRSAFLRPLRPAFGPGFARVFVARVARV